MARLSGREGASKSFTWTTVLYLLLVFIAPLALLGTAHAEKNDSVQENYGTGMSIALDDTFSVFGTRLLTVFFSANSNRY